MTAEALREVVRKSKKVDRRLPIDISQRSDVPDLQTVAVPVVVQQEKETSHHQQPSWRAGAERFRSRSRKDKGRYGELVCSDD